LENESVWVWGLNFNPTHNFTKGRTGLVVKKLC